MGTSSISVVRKSGPITIWFGLPFALLLGGCAVGEIGADEQVEASEAEVVAERSVYAAAKLGTGKACSSSSQCSSKYCAEGVCCDKKCDANCYSCLKVQTGKSDGKCAPTSLYSVDGTCSNCDGKGNCVCGKVNQKCCMVGKCNSGGFCSYGHVCLPFLKDGAACEGGFECASKKCIYGQCTTCGKAGQQCCEGSCDSKAYCEYGNKCYAKKAKGKPCGATEECISNRCDFNTGKCL